MAERLARLDIHSLFDLLTHRPFRFEDRTRVTPIGELRDGELAVVEGHIAAVRTRPRPRPSLELALSDASGSLDVRFFHFSPAQARALHEGLTIRCVGQPRIGRRGRLELYHPEYLTGEGALPPLPDTLTPVYPATAGVAQGRLRAWIGQLLDALPDEIGAMLDNVVLKDLLGKN